MKRKITLGVAALAVATSSLFTAGCMFPGFHGQNIPQSCPPFGNGHGNGPCK